MESSEHYASSNTSTVVILHAFAYVRSASQYTCDTLKSMLHFVWVFNIAPFVQVDDFCNQAPRSTQQHNLILRSNASPIVLG